MTLTADDVILHAMIAGFQVRLRPDGSPEVVGEDGKLPNAALLAQLRSHRAEIISLLGGKPTDDKPTKQAPAWEPVVCEGTTRKGKRLECGLVIYRPEDSEAFCMQRNCPQRRRAREHDGDHDAY